MTAKGFFITGTDTDVGKTTIALALMDALQKKGLIVAAMKPVSAGCENTEYGLRNEDAVRLMQQASIELPYDVVNPYAFEAQVAPHIAAAEQNITMDIDAIQQAYQHIAAKADVVIVEGAGGWLVPLTATHTMADIVNTLNVDVIQVVGLKLGCLNHALLTSASIAAHGARHVGWITNSLTENMNHQEENILSLQQRLPGNYLGHIPWQTISPTTPANLNNVVTHLNIDSLLPQ
jgi:dethiobiotin synthetase